MVADATEPPLPGVTWVLGSSGLLGSALCRALSRRGQEIVTSQVPWRDRDAAVARLLADAERLPRGARLAWCAGAGVVTTGGRALDQERAVVEGFLDRWSPAPGTLAATFFASSAGGAYAGSTGPPFSEDTVPRPLAAYGETKLGLERAFAAHAERTGAGLLVGRLANLYGPGQDLDKGQGLVSMLCEAVVRRQQVSIYVPGDTLRDYLYVDDAAAMIAAALDDVTAAGGVHVKILASGRAMTVGEVVAQVSRVARRRPALLLRPSEASPAQVRDLRLRSTAWPEVQRHARTPVAVGVAACLAATALGVRLPGQLSGRTP